MIRIAAAALALFASAMPSALAVEVTVGSVQVTRFKDAELDQRVDKLIWRGGISMQTLDTNFGGLSGLAFTSTDQHVAFVTDRGNFVTGQLVYDEAGRLFGFIGANIEPIQNSKGEPLPRQYARDAEGVTTIIRNGAPSGLRVAFENLTRVADFELTDGVPGGPATEIAIPQWLSDTRTNESLEAICIAPPASPVAGSTLLITEAALDEAGNHRAFMLGQNDKGALSYAAGSNGNPSDCTFLPNGDLLVLERGVAFLSFTMALVRVPAAEVRPDNLMTGEVLLSASGSTIDNMESVSVHTAPNGETRIVIGSDNNFNDWQRSLLFEFALAE